MKFFSTSLFLFSFAATSSQNKNTILIDQLKLPASILVWYDKFYDEHSIKPCGTYNIKKFGSTRNLNIDHPTLFVLPIGDQIPYYITPNDTIIFYTSSRPSIFGKFGTPTLKHKSNKLKTNEIKFFEEVFDSIGACYGFNSYSTPKNIFSIRQTLNYHLEVMNKRNSFLFRRIASKQISNQFGRYAKEYFYYKFFDDVLNSFQSRKFPDTITKNLALKISDSLIHGVNNTEGKKYYSWYDALKQYVELKIDWGEIETNSFTNILNSLSQNLYGDALNFSVFYLYKLTLEKYPKLIKGQINNLSKYCADKEYVSYITGNTEFVRKNNSDKIYEKALAYNGKQRRLTTYINNLKGRVIYVDFWASWCIPCLEEMPFSKKLIEHYRNEDIIFLLLSTDKVRDKWKRSIIENGMEKFGNHFLLLDGDNNYFIKKYNISSIPRYFLINKKGEVIYADAPRPSEEITKELINKLLKE